MKASGKEAEKTAKSKDCAKTKQDFRTPDAERGARPSNTSIKDHAEAVLDLEETRTGEVKEGILKKD